MPNTTDADEVEICQFLKSWPGQFLSGKTICRRAGGKWRFREDENWAGRKRDHRAAHRRRFFMASQDRQDSCSPGLSKSGSSTTSRRDAVTFTNHWSPSASAWRP